MRKKQEIKSVCGNCKKEQPIDKEKSNKNWKYYDNTKKCSCGILDWKLKVSSTK